jgi:hypothetical protein
VVKSAQRSPVKKFAAIETSAKTFQACTMSKPAKRKAERKDPPPTMPELSEISCSPYPDIFLKFDFGLLTQTFCATEIEWIRIIFE